MILLLVWAIPFPIAIQIPIFGVYEDSIMLFMGLTSLAIWVWYLVKKRKESSSIEITSSP
jgi:LPXTG-motif cell wall-anchored protein